MLEDDFNQMWNVIQNYLSQLTFYLSICNTHFTSNTALASDSTEARDEQVSKARGAISSPPSTPGRLEMSESQFHTLMSQVQMLEDNLRTLPFRANGHETASPLQNNLATGNDQSTRKDEEHIEAPEDETQEPTSGLAPWFCKIAKVNDDNVDVIDAGEFLGNLTDPVDHVLEQSQSTPSSEGKGKREWDSETTSETSDEFFFNENDLCHATHLDEVPSDLSHEV
ncbi:hypothetical protein BDY21DRAFT_366603 [Lineolata rhizophorae]|uniref:Uncharacterized protein n=1 Tax=Lineolata rhizophorae TaxID=578093 RepID=A0A6A6NQ36_9PEZI|nr:hypothetical protein BDY21DRAFT_366603 [Lineolata rhizophorae]